jgi:hypothetical protein
MFVRSRFVAIDDKQAHLQGIKSVFNDLMLDCHTLHYQDETVGDWPTMPGTRVIFMDQNLTAGANFNDGNASVFAAISDVLQRVVCPDSGPFALIMWAEQPTVGPLMDFLRERMTGENAHILPIFYAELKKGDYINTTNGDVINAAKLKADILDCLEQSPQMKALFMWEADVAKAADEVLRSVVDLVSSQHRGSDQFPAELGKVLFYLAQAGSGHRQEQNNPRGAINQLLAPVLSDRITSRRLVNGAPDYWRDALTQPNAGEAVPISTSGAMNSAIHLAVQGDHADPAIEATDLGAIVKFPWDGIADVLLQRFGLPNDIFQSQDFFGCSAEELINCQFYLVRIGAPCDSAQPKPGNIQFLLALAWPYTNDDGGRGNGATFHKRKSICDKDHAWTSPTLLLPASGEPTVRRSGKVTVFLNCSISLSRAEALAWVATARFRENLITTLTQQYARHVSRPGVLSL